MESRAGANMQQNDEKSVEKLMDEHLRANGLCRKKIAKDGSCLFRAVAEQVLHCQSLHTRVRAECVKYLRQKRDVYESFIEGDFEEYLHTLQDPQSWVGQVEISALAVLYKHDFMIYQRPGEPPVNITENGYPNKVLLCFLNGNHYDSVYPIPTVKNAALCQSILYEMLYERVYGVDQSVLTSSLKTSKTKNETVETEQCESSGDSDLNDGDDFWSSEATGRMAGVNNRTAYKGRGRGQARGVGRGSLHRKVQESLNPALYRNVEYDVWMRSKRVQQRRDFCMAAGMHYKAGDKCQVRLNTTDRFYGAYIQDVSPDDGPVTVFIEELGEKHTVPLWNLRSSSEDSWSKVTEKSKKQTTSSNNGPTEHETRPGRKPMRSVSHGPTASSGSAPGNRIQHQHSWPPKISAEPQSIEKNDSSRRSDQGTGSTCVSPVEKDEHALLEILNKDEENFPTLEASSQAASAERSRRAEKKGSRKKAPADTKEQSLNPVPKEERGKQSTKASVDEDQRITPPPKEDLNPSPASTLSAPSASKSSKAAPSSTAPARVPYKTSSLSARIYSVNSKSDSGLSTKSTDSLQTTPVQSPTGPAPSLRPGASLQTTPVQSPTGPAPSLRPGASLQTAPIQYQTAHAPSSTPTVEAQAALDTSKVIPLSSKTTLAQPQTLPSLVTTISSPVSSQCTPTLCLTVPKPIAVTTNSFPQNTSQTIQSQVSDLTATITTPVPLDHVPEPTTTTTILSQTTTIPLSPDKPPPITVSTQLFTPSSSQTAPAPTHAFSQTTSAASPVSVPSQITSAAEVPVSTDLSAASKSQPYSAGVPIPVHAPHSITPPALPTPFPAPSYPVGFGTPLPYPPYPPYPACVPSLSPKASAPMTDPCLPPAIPTPPFSHSADSYLYEPAVPTATAGAGSALLPDAPPQHSVTLAQLCQDMLYPGFPQNEHDEYVQLPSFSQHRSGKDLPTDTRVLRFFFNLGLKAYLYQMLPPVTYLAPLVQAYHHMQLKVSPSPVSWQPDTNSRPIFSSPNPSLAMSAPVSHFEVRGVVRTPSPMEGGVFSHPSLPLQMPLPLASHPNVYAGMCPVTPTCPPLQYSALPPSIGPQHLPVSPPQQYSMDNPMTTAAPITEGAQGDRRSLTPQAEKTFWAGQQHSEGRDVKRGAVPVTMEIQHSSGPQAGVSGGELSKGPNSVTLANGNRQAKGGGFSGSSLENCEREQEEFSDTDVITRQSYQSQSYKSGNRRGQDDRGGFRGRGSRGRREIGLVRHDGQLPYHRGSGGRNRGRGYNNTRVTGYTSRQLTPAPES
ncbi:OTU domain-containing protein 4 isoform X3 [Tachysurus vachellii]|uniref:OTU domain-containing protein 4 isoform X3 n=1 Tax=Tachysurus vachellii TaxID=175792 RepID=UPI00296B2FD7|nr:OTU domain-containing protein 4 isoform X3 [Tachysurus vachellii]